jgi:uncharacterized membrane protein
VADPHNPYAAPAARVEDRGAAPPGARRLIPGGQSVPAGNGWLWIAMAWRLFRANPGAWILITIVYLAVMFAGSLVPLAGPLAATVLTPALIAGIMAGCAAQERGEDLRVGHLFAGFQQKTGPLIAFGLLYLAGVAVIMVVMFAFVGAGMMKLASAGVLDPQLISSFLLAGLVGAALSVPLAMGIWFGAPLILFHDLGPVQAFRTSFSGCLRNLLPFLVYGLAMMVLLFLAAIPAFLGLLVMGPVGMASIYTSYRDIFEADGD